MSFDERFDNRWTRVLKPALEGLAVDSVPLTAFRVDLGKGSDAILTEILQHIADSHVIVADISAFGELDGRPIRNANVMYEVGLAHAVRLPEEVVLFRSDQSKIDFDVSGVRIHSYDPDADEVAARKTVQQAVVDSLAAREQRARMSIRWAAQRLTLPATNMLLEVFQTGKTNHPPLKTFGELVAGSLRTDAIELLLELGAIRSEVVRLTPELLEVLKSNPQHEMPMLEYALTAFGRQMAEHVLIEMGAFDDGMQEHIQALHPELQEPPRGAS